MVVHVAVTTTYSFILALLLVELWNHGNDPLDMPLGILL